MNRRDFVAGGLPLFGLGAVPTMVSIMPSEFTVGEDKYTVFDWHGKVAYRYMVESWLGISYYLDGQLHREDGPARISPKLSRQEWYRHGKCHREDGPALVSSRGEAWHFDGRHHRDNGPAVTILGKETNSYYWYTHGCLKKIVRVGKTGTVIESISESPKYSILHQL